MILMHLGSDSLVPVSHLAVSSQLHSLQPDHHLLGTDASRRVPLTASFQLHIPDEHKTFRGFHCTNHVCERLTLTALLKLLLAYFHFLSVRIWGLI